MAYTPSNDYKTQAKSLSVFWKSYIKVIPDNIDITDETYLQSWTLKNEIYNEQNNTLIGNAVSKLLNLQFVNDNTYNLENKEIELYLGVVKNPTADKASWVIEYVPHGKYIVQPIASGDIPAITKFTAYDYMIKLNGKFEQGSLTYPTTATLLLQHIASQCGVTLHSSVFTNDDFAIEDGTSFTEYTYREVLSSIAKLSGTVAIINRDNELQLKYFNDYSGMEEITATGSEITINEPTNTNKAFITNISGSSSQLTIASGNNKVVNGNFVDTSSWTTSNATFTVSNNIASITASAQWGRIEQTISTVSGHKYYASAYITGDTLKFIQIGSFTEKYATSTTRQRVSVLITSASSSYPLKFGDKKSSGWTPFTVEQAFVVDLTALFGAGLEPTIEWCDVNLTYDRVTNGTPTPTSLSVIDSVGNGEYQGNKVVNGNFNGTTNWTAFNSTLTATNNKLRVVVNSTNGEHYAEQTFNNFLANHKYYFKANVENIFTGKARISIYNRKSDGNYESASSSVVSTSSTLSQILTTTSIYSTPLTMLRLNIFNSAGGSSYAGTTEEATFSNVFLVDLTATFGAGSEPTLAWCDNNLTYEKVTNGTAYVNLLGHKKNLFNNLTKYFQSGNTTYSKLTDNSFELGTITNGAWGAIEFIIASIKPYTNYYLYSTHTNTNPSVTDNYIQIKDYTSATVRKEVYLGSGNGFTFNSGSSSSLIIRFHCTAGTAYTNTATFTNIQLEEGTTATSYEPYEGNEYSITLDEPLRSLPNGVKDTIDNGVLTRRVGKVVLDGSERWGTSQLGSDYARYYLVVSGVKQDRGIICSHFVYKRGIQDINNNTIIGYCSDGRWQSNYLFFGTNITTLAAFKTWLASNNITVYYELATPTTENVTVPSIDTFEDYTIISTTNTVKPTMEISYYKDVENIIKDNYFTFDKSNQFGGINELVLNSYDIDGLNVTEQDSQGIIDNGLMPITIQEKLLMYNQTLRTNAITELWSNLHNIEYRPFTMKTSSFNWLDPFDKITITDIDSNSYSTYVFNQVLTYNGSFKNELKTIALTQKEVELKYVNSENLSKQRTEIIVNQHTNEIQLINEELQDFAIINQGGTAPESPNTGDLWLNTNDNIIYRYDGSEWKATSINSDSLLQYYTKAEIDVRDSSITSSVSELQVSLNNDYYTSSQTQSLIDANSEDITYINGQITTLNQTSSKLSLDVTKIQTDGVDKVTTTTGFKFDDTGLNISKTDEPMRSLIDNTGLYVDKYVGEIAENQLTVNDTGISGKQLKISTSFEIGTKSKIQDYEDGTGIFYIG